MGFVDESGDPLRVIPLTQAPADGRYFQLVRRIGFRESDRGEIYWAPAHVPAVDPQDGNRTDLASVPSMLWSFIASYGRQSAPAIIHDHRSDLASRLGGAGGAVQRREDDRILRVGLRQQKVPLLRAWLMWTFVSVQRFQQFHRRAFVLLIAQTILGVALSYLAVVLAFGTPLWLLTLVVPAAAALFWRRDAALVVWLSYGLAVLAPLLVLQFCAIAPFRLLEFLARELIDRPFLDRTPGPVYGPFAKGS